MEGLSEESKKSIEAEYAMASLTAINEEKNEGLDPAEVD